MHHFFYNFVFTEKIGGLFLSLNIDLLILFSSQVIFPFMNIPSFYLPIPYWWLFSQFDVGCFVLFCMVNSAVVLVHFLWGYFYFIGWILRNVFTLRVAMHFCYSAKLLCKIFVTIYIPTNSVWVYFPHPLTNT